MRFSIALFLVFVSQHLSPAEEEIINPFPRAVLGQQLLKEWKFEQSKEGWILEKDLESTGEALELRSTGVDPILTSPAIRFEQQVVLKVLMKTTVPGPGQVFWVGQDQPGASEDFRTQFSTQSDGAWHEYDIECPFSEPLRQIRIDPGVGEGAVEIDWIRAEQRRLHPIELQAVGVEDAVRLRIRNHSSETIEARIDGQPEIALPPGTTETQLARKTGAGLLVHDLKIEADGFPPVLRTITYLGNSTGDSVVVQPDGSAVFLSKSVMLAPLASRDGRPIPLNLVSRSESNFVFESEAEKIRLALQIEGNRIRYTMRARDEIEGPAVRVRGGLEQAMLAGVEHLGKGERSSSKLDLRGPEHVRFAPDPLHLTMPFAAFITDETSVAMTWRDPAQTQPIFATPNFFEGTNDHRMALRGRDLRATIRIGEPWAERRSDEGDRLPELIFWAIEELGGLPARPQPPRTFEQQIELSLRGFRESVIAGENGGWFHAVVPGHRTTPAEPKIYADHLSSIFRMTGEIPKFDEIIFGGGHVENGSIFFLTGRAESWLRIQKNRAASLIQSQKPDGSWRYGGEFREGHFEDTSSGHCGRSAQQLLAFAKATGDPDALEAGLRALKFIERFRTPRGAQFWECPLHAPDLLAAAYLVKAFTLGFELTGNQRFREQAIDWALSGVPYVYLWSDRPVMRYATIATLCATNWQAPVWIGRPVQWCGLVYADALLDLAEHDDTLDWPKLAEGILISGEQQIYTEGESTGLLADSLTLENQKLHPYDINPSTIADLRMRVDNGRPAGLTIARGDGHVVVSPFPFRIENGKAIVEASQDFGYQILIDGERVVKVEPGSETQIDLDTTR